MRTCAEVHATDGGMTTDRYVKYYEEKAKGGCGLCICGGSSMVSIDSPQGWWSSVNLSTDRIIPYFQNLADAVHKHGGKIMIQITHMVPSLTLGWLRLVDAGIAVWHPRTSTPLDLQDDRSRRDLADYRRLRPGRAPGEGRRSRRR